MPHLPRPRSRHHLHPRSLETFVWTRINLRLFFCSFFYLSIFWQKTPLTVRVGAIARQLRSKVRDEFLGRPETFGGSGRLKEIVSATTRYTTRESMVLARPFSAVTGSVRTNVPLPGDDGGGGWTGNPRPDGKVVATASGFGGLGPVDIDGGGRFW